MRNALTSPRGRNRFFQSISQGQLRPGEATRFQAGSVSAFRLRQTAKFTAIIFT